MMIWPFLKIDNKAHTFKDIIEKIKRSSSTTRNSALRSSSEQLAKEREKSKPNIQIKLKIQQKDFKLHCPAGFEFHLVDYMADINRTSGE